MSRRNHDNTRSLFGLPNRFHFVQVASCHCSGVAAVDHRLSPASLGDLSFLRATHEGDFARAPKATHYDRPISLLTKPALSRRECFHLWGSSTVPWITGWI